MEPVGFVIPEGSFMVFDALATQWSTSTCISDFCVGADMIVMSGWVNWWVGLVLRKGGYEVGGAAVGDVKC